ncbi:MAG: hypothetical protein AAFR81_27115 [Chloroflexota bacterium]
MQPIQFEPPDSGQQPEYSQSINVRVTEIQKAQLRSIAHSYGISESALVRNFCIQAINQLIPKSEGDEIGESE